MAVTASSGHPGGAMMAGMAPPGSHDGASSGFMGSGAVNKVGNKKFSEDNIEFFQGIDERRY